MVFVPDFQATAKTCKQYQDEGSFRTIQPQGPMTATDQQKCDGYFFLTKQPRVGSPEWQETHLGKFGGRRRGTRKNRKNRKTRKSGKSRRNRH
jgi:hypothetical protein